MNKAHLLALFALSSTGCIEFRAAPTVAGNQGTVVGAATLGARIYDNDPGHYYDSIRPVFGAAANASIGDKSTQRLTIGPEVGLDNFWTDEDHANWSFRGVFVRGELGNVTDSVHGHDGTINYFGGGATALFRLAGIDTITWGFDASLGTAKAADGTSGATWTGSLVVEWP
jgi:hypothetical protein